MTEAKNVKEQFFCDQNMQKSYFRKVSLFNALPFERRLSSRNLYNCLVIRLSVLNASLPSPPLKTKLFPYMPVPVMGRLLLKYH